ncbi:MAG: superoxide dismutase [Chloroflexota bacterium]|jgi:Superoxide dismutase|nr:MAG: superoxide dismutase [Chloroflexota bacterium]
MAFTLPPLPYDAAALEPHIDAQTMQIHHGKHHATYVTNLNAALEGHPNLQNATIEELLTNINDVPESIRQAVINNGGGHHNHTLFWSIMGPGGGGEPSGALAQAINKAFGSFNEFKAKIKDNGLKRFGSGWSWLVMDKDGNLHAYSTANQDSPLMQGHIPLLGVDVWEHAYYLKYQNRRADYLEAWWNTINWNAVAERFGR